MNIETEFDAIVVGSGISGGWAAKELTEKGLKVLMLERGTPASLMEQYGANNLEEAFITATEKKTVAPAAQEMP